MNEKRAFLVEIFSSCLQGYRDRMMVFIKTEIADLQVIFIANIGL
jgi:hypothetical protein